MYIELIYYGSRAKIAQPSERMRYLAQRNAVRAPAPSCSASRQKPRIRSPSGCFFGSPKKIRQEPTRTLAPPINPVSYGGSLMPPDEISRTSAPSSSARRAMPRLRRDYPAVCNGTHRAVRVALPDIDYLSARFLRGTSQLGREHITAAEKKAPARGSKRQSV